MSESKLYNFISVQTSSDILRQRFCTKLLIHKHTKHFAGHVITIKHAATPPSIRNHRLCCTLTSHSRSAIKQSEVIHVCRPHQLDCCSIMVERHAMLVRNWNYTFMFQPAGVSIVRIVFEKTNIAITLQLFMYDFEKSSNCDCIFLNF